MARKNKTGFGEFHRIMIRDTFDKMLFAYITGALRSNPGFNSNDSIPLIIRDFFAQFGIEGDVDGAKTTYDRMLREYRGDAETFKQQINEGYAQS
jgi:hypothetical protein